jgi:hypothetical protein
MPKFVKRPVVIEAEQFTYIDGPKGEETTKLAHRLGVANMISQSDPLKDPNWSIVTLEGVHEVSEGDWVITGIEGEKYPCKDRIFRKTYVAVEEGLPVAQDLQYCNFCRRVNPVSEGCCDVCKLTIKNS